MELSTVYATAGLVGLVATWTMAAFLWARAREGDVNRHLAILLVAEGIVVSTAGLNLLMPDRATSYAMSILHIMADVALPPLYLLFLSHALDLPGIRALRSRAAHAVLWAAAVAGPVVIVVYDRQFFSGVGEPGPWLLWHFAYVTAGFLVGIVAALAAYVRARTPTAKQRARFFLAAFLLFDLVWGTFYGLAAAAVSGAVPVTWPVLFGPAYLVATPVFVGILAYAILKVQLFDIDLRLKVGIKRGTIALAFLIVFVAVAEIAQAVLSTEYGLAAGGLVAGLMLVAIRPLERAADRVAHAAMPRVDGSPEYVAYKKLEVYRAAVESALEADGRIDAREEAKLARLAAKLGVRPEDAAAVQRDAEGTMTGPAPVAA